MDSFATHHTLRNKGAAIRQGFWLLMYDQCRPHHMMKSSVHPGQDMQRHLKHSLCKLSSVGEKPAEGRSAALHQCTLIASLASCRGSSRCLLNAGIGLDRPCPAQQFANGGLRARRRCGLTFYAGKAYAEELGFLFLLRKVHCGPDPRLVVATVLLKLGAWHDCNTSEVSAVSHAG